MKENFVKDFGLLIEGGFIAIKQGNRDAAEKLFEAAKLLRPDHTAPWIGLGSSALNRLDINQATHCFEQAIKIDPDNHEAAVYLGLTFILIKTNYSRMKSSYKPEQVDPIAKEGVKLIQEVLKNTKDPAVKRLGDAALELAKKVDTYQETPLKTH